MGTHGNGTLWVGGRWPHGVIEAGPDFVTEDGSEVTGTLPTTSLRFVTFVIKKRA